MYINPPLTVCFFTAFEVAFSSRTSFTKNRERITTHIKKMDNRNLLAARSSSTSSSFLTAQSKRRSIRRGSLNAPSAISRWKEEEEEEGKGNGGDGDRRVFSHWFGVTNNNREKQGQRQRRRRRRQRQSSGVRAHGTTFSAAAYASGNGDDAAGGEAIRAEEEDPSTAPLVVRDKIKGIILFVLPLMASNVISPLLTMTDTAFVGRYASDAVVSLAALGVATPLTDYPVNLFMFVTAGVTSIVSNGLAVREPKRDMERKVYGAMFISFTLAITLAALLVCFPDALLSLLGVEKIGPLREVARKYVQIRGLAMPAAFLTGAGYASLVAREDTITPLMCVSLAAITNVILDYVAVVTLKQGATGAAWATSASLYVGAICIFTVLRRRKLFHIPPPAPSTQMISPPMSIIPTKEMCAPVMKFFAPITFLSFSILSLYVVLILQANAIGNVASAAHRIAGNIFTVCALCGDPLVQVGQTMLPKYIAFTPKNDGRNARKMALIVQAMGYMVGIVSASICFWLLYFGASGFTTDSSVIACARSVVLPVFAATVANIVSKSLYGVMVAMKQLSFLAGLTAIGTSTFMAAVFAINKYLNPEARYYALWWCLFSYYAIAVVVLTIRVATTRLVNKERYLS